jgi:hypothetical protein
VLEAVKRERRVAWILLSNTSVLSVADGILTLRFTRDGDLKAFGASGHDAILRKVLTADFGLTVSVKGVVGGDAPLGAGGTTPPPAPDPAPAPAPAAPAAAAPPAARPDSTRPGFSARRNEPDDLPPEPDEPSEDDAPADGPGELTGLDLVQRELGGKVIGEFED